MTAALKYKREKKRGGRKKNVRSGFPSGEKTKKGRKGKGEKKGKSSLGSLGGGEQT